MIRNINKLLKKTTGKKPPLINQQETKQTASPDDVLTSDLKQNVALFQSIYKDCFDVVFRSFRLFGQTHGCIIYIQGLSDSEGLEHFVLTPLLQKETTVDSSNDTKMLENLLPVVQVEKIREISKCVEAISNGNPLLLCEGEDYGYILGLAKTEKRTIDEPVAEGSIRGSREGFTESVEIGTSLLRKIIKSPALKMRHLSIGKYSKTKVIVAYIEGIAEQPLIQEIISRLERIEIDGIMESGYLEELIEDNPYSPFPQIIATERPDIACANLLEGRAVILVEGTPFCLIAPISFFSLLQAHEDYNQRFMVGTLIRWLRYLFLFVSLLFPSLYVALMTFHQEMVPTMLLLSIATSREPVPFPAIVEALLMEVSFEALREAGVRMPKQIASAVSIVGALVIGQAAVQAGLVSAPMVIVVAITGIASFMVPRYTAGIALRMLRFPIMLLASTLGLLGIVLGVIAIAIHLCTLRSFGQPYLEPIAPFKKDELKDVLWRAPLWMYDLRPHNQSAPNIRRQKQGLRPRPPKNSE